MANEITFEELKELFREVAATQKEVAKAQKEVTEAQREAAGVRKETDLKLKELGAYVKELSKQLGGMGNNNGYFAEQFFAHSLKEKKTIGGIQFDEVETKLKHKRKDVVDEFDIVMYNGDSIAIVEVKYVAALADLKNLIEKKAANFKYLYPEYASYKIYLGLAVLSFENEAIKQKAIEAGVAILEAKGDHAEIIANNMKAY